MVTTAPTGMCPSTLEQGMDVTSIGALSNRVTHIEGIATGPLWTTFNVFNQLSVKSRVIYGRTFDVFALANNITVKQDLSEK